MSFSESGGVITQTGTDTDLSGLNGITGVTRVGYVTTGSLDYYLYDIGTNRLDIEGSLTINPEYNALLTNSTAAPTPNMAINVRSTGTLILGEKTVVGSAVRYTKGTAIIATEQGSLTADGPLYVESGGTLEAYGPTIELAGVVKVASGAYLTVEDLKVVFISGIDTQFRIEATGTETSKVSITNNGLTLDGRSSAENARLTTLNTGSDTFNPDSFVFNFLRGYYQPFSGGYADQVFLNFDNGNNVSDTSDFSYAGSGGGGGGTLYNGRLVDFRNVAKRLRYARANTKGGFCKTTKNLNFNLVDADFNGLSDVAYYAVDTDNGGRIDFNDFDSTADLVYSGSGVNTSLAVNVVVEYMAGESETRYIDDRLNNDTITFKFISYATNIASASPNCIGLNDLGVDVVNPFDSLITEATKATVDAYTEIDTTEKFYDRAKAYLCDNYAGESSTIVSRSGSTIDAGSYNVTIDATAGSAFAFDGSTITIKASTFTGNITTTGTFTLANGATVVGSVTDTGGTEFSTSIEITNLTSADIYVEDNLGNQFDYQTGVTGTYNNTAPFGSTGTWKVVINRAGYIASVNTFTVDGNTKSYNGDLVQLTQPSGSPMYTGSSSGVLSVVPETDGSRMNVRIGNGTVTAQQVLDESEVALSTAAGMEYLGNGGGRLEFASLATGTFLFLKTNVRLIRDTAPDSSATVEAFVTSSDGVILDSTNGGVQFVTVTRAQQLIEYDHAIYIDAVNGTNANVYPYGTEANPVDSWSNAKILADFYGFRNIRFKGNLTLDADLEGYIVEGGGVLDTLNISNFSVQGSTFLRMNMLGSGTGFRACETVNLMNGITNLSGTFALCAFNEQFSIADNQSATFSRCISNLPGLTAPQMNLGANTQAAIRDYDGAITVSGSTAGCNTTLDFTSGKAVLDNTNTGGTISVRGITRTAFTDNSAGTTVDSVGVLENEVMRGTDGANTIAPDNAGIAAIPTNPLLTNDSRLGTFDTKTNVKPSVSV